MPDLYETFREVVQTQDERGIPFAICGGLAMAVATLGFRAHRTTILAAGGSVVIHRLTKIVPGDPDVLVLDAIEVRPGPRA